MQADDDGAAVAVGQQRRVEVTLTSLFSFLIFRPFSIDQRVLALALRARRCGSGSTGSRRGRATASSAERRERAARGRHQPKPPLTYSRVRSATGEPKTSLGLAVLDQVAEVHEGDVVGDALGLLQVVGDDHDRDLGAQLDDQLLDHLRSRSGRAPSRARRAAAPRAATASERAMQRRCCWPPESASAGWSRLSLTSSKSPARCSASIDRRLELALARAASTPLAQRRRRRCRRCSSGTGWAAGRASRPAAAAGSTSKRSTSSPSSRMRPAAASPPGSARRGG